jgi:hypothetical protein
MLEADVHRTQYAPEWLGRFCWSAAAALPFLETWAIFREKVKTKLRG